MKGDITRSTFDPKKHYASVRWQQGRVQLDADGNEQADITSYRIETEARDLIGLCGGPQQPDGFRVLDGAQPRLTAGRYYVDGILCENETEIDLNDQPDLPGYLDTLAPTAGLYFAYLDVWRRHISGVEDRAIIETALGVDTTTRSKTVWQVKLVRAGALTDSIHCLSDSAAYDDAIADSTGMIRARSQPGGTSDDPCVVEPGAGYRRLENQLYRVEIRTPGAPGTATFVWSRDNGSHVTRLKDEISGALIVESSGRDQFTRFAAGQWVEISDDTSELYGRPGVLVKLKKVEGEALTIDDTAPGSGPFDKTQYTNNPKVRAWESDGEITTATAWIPLEDGVEVLFEAGDFHSGDYWLIPARTATGSIEWPQTISGTTVTWLPKAKDGSYHHYCRLAVVSLDDAGSYKTLEDCRHRFPPVTELTRFFYIGGDGQETLPGEPVPQTLQVGVMNGLMPVAGADVAFETTLVDGRVVAAPIPFTPADAATALALAATTNRAIVQTDAQGIARAVWRLAPLVAGLEVQQVTATLLNGDGSVSPHPAIVFTANYSLASRVSYDPSNCPPLAAANADTVQKAIEALCAMQTPEEPGIHVVEVRTGDSVLENDTPVTLAQLVQGIRVICDGVVDEASVKRPVGSVTLELPFEVQLGSPAALNLVQVGYQPIILEGRIEGQGESILWRLSTRTARWLHESILPQLTKEETQLLLWLRLKGNFIWSKDDQRLYLDGEAFGVPKGSITALSLPSGNGKRGGDFEMWMWLQPDQPRQRVLRWSIEGVATPGSIDPASVNDSQDWTVIHLLYAGLVRLVPSDGALTPQPDLAARWEISEDRRQYTFFLRPGITFSDGTPITSKDVFFSFRRAANFPDGWSGPFYLSEIENIEVIDDATVRITIVHPSAYFLGQLTTAPAKIIPEARNAQDFTVTSGAFTLAETLNDGFTLNANPNYWQPPSIDQVRIVFHADSTSALAAYRAGDVHVMGSLQTSVPNEGLALPNLNRSEVSSGVRYLGFNHKAPPFNNPFIRLAMARAIDRDTLIGAIDGASSQSRRIVPPGVPSIDPDFSITFDLQEALSLLDRGELQPLDGLRLFYATEGDNQQVVQIIADMLTRLFATWANQRGLPVPQIALQGLELRDFSKLLNDMVRNEGNSDVQLYYSFWGADYPDAQNLLSQQFQTGRDNNNGGYSDPEFDPRVARADASEDPQERLTLYQQAERIALGAPQGDSPGNVAWVPLFNPAAASLIQPDVTGLVVTSQGIIIPDYSALGVPV